MKAPSPAKAKTASPPRANGQPRLPAGEFFLGYKALHELRILLRIASSRNPLPPKPESPSF
jgi:hypothetical protein